MVNGPLGRFPTALNGVPRDLQYSPEGLHEYSRDLPRGSIHHDSPEGFSEIFILMSVLDQFLCSRQVHAPPPLLRRRRAARSFLPSGAPSVANALRPSVVSYSMLYQYSKSWVFKSSLVFFTATVHLQHIGINLANLLIFACKL